MEKKNAIISIIVAAVIFAIVGFAGGYKVGRDTSEMNRVVSSTDSVERYADYEQTTSVASEEVLEADRQNFVNVQNGVDEAAEAATASTASTASTAEEASEEE